MQLASAAPSASQVSPSVHRTAAPAPLHPVTAATTRQPPLDAPRTCSGPDGFGGAGSVVVVTVGGIVVVGTDVGSVVVVTAGTSLSSRWSRGRSVAIEFSREA